MENLLRTAVFPNRISMAIQLYDSLTRQLRALAPADGKTFRMYCCGPTVYGPAHIGNFRTFILQDVLRRVLELEGKANGWTVKHVRNLTDVDDKTIRRAQEEGRSLNEVTKQWIEKFQDDCKKLNLLEPGESPKATDHIREQVEMIEALLAKGLAYIAPDGSVYYKIEKFADYGKLSRVKERELKVTDAAADSDHKDSIGDFALWKAWKPEDGAVKWPGPKGAADGRPGWHLECSAMSRKHLGDALDLHAGGVDLLFPHHENEIAQSEGCTGHTFARHWWHTEHLLVDGKKMSKSLGNLYTLDDLTAKGFSPMAVRYALLSGHPRSQLNFTLDSLHAAESALGKLKRIARQFLSKDACTEVDFADYWRSEKLAIEFPVFVRNWSVFGTAYNHLQDNLNTPSALGSLFEWAGQFDFADQKGSYRYEGEIAALSRLLFALGIRLFDESEGQKEPSSEILVLAEKRWSAKQSKDFATADKLRAEIQAQGWQMLDGRDGYKLEPAKR